MTRERPVRFCEGGEVRFLSAIRLVVGFEHEVMPEACFQHDARRFWDGMRGRFEEFALSLHPEKTRLIEFGRFAADNRARRGLGKPETFNFLGLTHICGRSRRGKFLLHRRSRRDRVRAKLKEIKEALRRRMHQPIPEQGKWLGQVVRGFFAYHAVPTNGPALSLSATMLPTCGGARSGGAARRTGSCGRGSRRSPTTGSPNRRSVIPGPALASPSNTRGGSRMRESRTYGSVRGASSNGRPYRDPTR